MCGRRRDGEATAGPRRLAGAVTPQGTPVRSALCVSAPLAAAVVTIPCTSDYTRATPARTADTRHATRSPALHHWAVAIALTRGTSERWSLAHPYPRDAGGSHSSPDSLRCSQQRGARQVVTLPGVVIAIAWARVAMQREVWFSVTPPGHRTRTQGRAHAARGPIMGRRCPSWCRAVLSTTIFTRVPRMGVHPSLSL